MTSEHIFHGAHGVSARAASVVEPRSSNVHWGRGNCLKAPARLKGLRRPMGESPAPACSVPGALPSRCDLGSQRRLEVEPGDETVLLRVASPNPDEGLELEIRFEAGGPVVKTRAASLELDAVEAVTARCETFRVEAEGDIDLQAGGQFKCRADEAASISARSFTADASPGAVRLCANDDVQLLGELILLNCDRLPPMPEWVPEQSSEPQLLASEVSSGDAELVDALVSGDQEEIER